MVDFTKKEYNAYLLLNLINKYGAISRTQLNELTGLRAATITDITKELMEKGFIKEEGFSNSGRGRNQKLLIINNDHLCAIGISIEADEVSFLVSTFSGYKLKYEKKSLCTCKNAEQIMALISDAAKELIREFGNKRIIGVGVGDPGVVDATRERSLLSTQMKGWHNIPLKSILEKALNLPVILENNDRLKAMGEMKYGLARNIDDFICVQLGAGSGIGISIVSNGELLRGADGLSGELGHIRTADGTAICACGNFGCLEAVASLEAIKEQITKALDQGVSSSIRDFAADIRSIRLEDIQKAASQNDRLCMNIIENAGYNIGAALANAVNILNPKMIIFESAMLDLGESLLNPIKAAVLKNALGLSAATLTFAVSELKEYAAPLGAVTMIFDEFLMVQYFRKAFMMLNASEIHSAMSII